MFHRLPRYCLRSLSVCLLCGWLVLGLPGWDALAQPTNSRLPSAVAISQKNASSQRKTQGNLGNDVLYYVFVDTFKDGEPGNNIPDFAFPVDDSTLTPQKQLYNQANRLLLPMMFDPTSFTNLGLFGGGDLKGVVQKLDYLQDLGVTKIILSPIQDTANGIAFYGSTSTQMDLGKQYTAPKDPFYSHALTSYHGYWIKDWFEIDEHFRQPEDQQGDRYRILRQLLNEAHKRDIGVLFDLTLHQTSPVNVSATAPPYNLNAMASNWFFDNGGVFKHGKLLAQFWDPITQKINPEGWFYPPMPIDWDRPTPELLQQGQIAPDLPTLNHQAPQVEAYLLEATKFWLTFNGEGAQIDGFRVDAVKHVRPEFWQKFEDLVYSINPNAILIGEYFSGGYKSRESLDWLKSTQHFTMFDFDLSGAMRNFFAGDRAWDGRAFILRQLCLGRQGISYTQRWYRWLQTLLNPAATLSIPKEALDQVSDEQARGWVTYVESHDVPRLMSAYPDLSDTAYGSLVKFQFIARGVPMITYGAEIGLGIPYNPGNIGLFGVGGDPFNRPMMVWPNTLGWRSQLHEVTRQMAHLRQEFPVLRYGNTQFLYPKYSHRDQDIFMLRQPQDCQVGEDADCAAILYTYSTHGGEFSIPLDGTHISKYQRVETGEQERVIGKTLALNLGAEASKVFILR
jgi:glycosidase